MLRPPHRLKAAITAATSGQGVLRALTAGTGPMTAHICASPNWDAAATALTDMAKRCARFGLVPSLNGTVEHAVLDVVGTAFKQRLPELVQTADHSAPMLDQVPDILPITHRESANCQATLELRSGAIRADVVFKRGFSSDD